VFRSEAKYFEPAGAVSWDVAMTATEDHWKVALQPGDHLKVSATYDTRKASWYESMGIMVVWYAEGIRRGAKDPFSERVDWRGKITHGHLRENRHHGGKRPILADARKLPDGPAGVLAKVRDFLYGLGDLNQSQRPPVVKAGQSLTFDAGADAAKAIYHTITGCKAPCNRETGIAYPIANGPTFDSGELGLGGPPTSNRVTWETPKDLRPGTYTYFCRIHPFMRGAFRVKK
jgi:plastocyanin